MYEMLGYGTVLYQRSCRMEILAGISAPPKSPKLMGHYARSDGITQKRVGEAN